MKHIIKIIKGSFVGMGSILPGISGSMIAAILKIYQDLIEALNDFTKHPTQAIKAVWQYIVGVFVGSGLGFVLIKLVYENFPIPVTFLFIGFILGAVPGLLKEIKNQKIKWHHMLVFTLTAVMMIGLLFVQESSATADSFLAYVVVFFIGVITAISLITPGLSGATILMALGYFHILINLGDEIIRALISFDFSKIISQLPMLLVLILGVLVGLIVMGKVMYQVLIHFKTHFYIGVLGIVFVSPFNILYTMQDSTETNAFSIPWYFYIMSLILFIIGILTTLKLSKNSGGNS